MPLGYLGADHGRRTLRGAGIIFLGQYFERGNYGKSGRVSMGQNV